MVWHSCRFAALSFDLYPISIENIKLIQEGTIFFWLVVKLYVKRNTLAKEEKQSDKTDSSQQSLRVEMIRGDNFFQSRQACFLHIHKMFVSIVILRRYYYTITKYTLFPYLLQYLNKREYNNDEIVITMQMKMF